MAQPPVYDRQANFTQYATTNPSSPYNAPDHDDELNAVKQTLDVVVGNLGLIQRDDGKLKNASVHADAFDTAALALIASDWTPRGFWVTATAYVVGDVVEEAGQSFVCAVAHTSGTFATDDAAGKWIILNGVTSLPASSVTFTPAGGLSSSTVQLALQELDTEKAALAGSASQNFSVADGTDDQHAVARRQIQKNELLHVVGGGTGNAITGTLATGGVTALSDGMQVSVRAPAASTNPVPTFNLTLDATATGAIDIVRGDTRTRLRRGDIGGAGHDLLLKYRASPSSWLLLNPAFSSGFGRKNRVIGGDFLQNPWQRGASFTNPADNAYTADRFRIARSDDAQVNVLRTADTPTAAEVDAYTVYCLHFDVTTADASIGAAQFYAVQHRLEGYSVADLGFGQSGTRYVTLSFWVKSGKTGVHCIAFRNGAGDRSYVAEYTVSLVNTWEYKTITIPVDTSGTWLYGNSIGLQFQFVLAAGSNFHTTAGAWQAGNLIATSSQVNLLDSASNDFKLAFVQLEKGQVATEFEFRCQQEELALCQRFYEKNYDYGVAPGTTGTAGAHAFRANGTAHLEPIRFKVEKRAAPTVTFYNQNSGATGTWRDTSAPADRAMTASAIGTSGFRADVTGSVDQNAMLGYWTAESEL